MSVLVPGVLELVTDSAAGDENRKCGGTLKGKQVVNKRNPLSLFLME